MKNLGVAFAGGNGVRRENDFYPTPPEATRALLPLIADWPLDVWEPCCGDGAISRVLEGAGFAVVSTDLVHRGYGHGETDFFKATEPAADTLITNPPFVDAAKFILHAHAIGVKRMALLLKMTFWNAATRRKVWSTWAPAAVRPLTWRLDFDGRGAPTMDCMWCLWEPGSEQALFEPIARPMKDETEALFA